MFPSISSLGLASPMIDFLSSLFARDMSKDLRGAEKKWMERVLRKDIYLKDFLSQLKIEVLNGDDFLRDIMEFEYKREKAEKILSIFSRGTVGGRLSLGEVFDLQ